MFFAAALQTGRNSLNLETQPYPLLPLPGTGDAAADNGGRPRAKLWYDVFTIKVQQGKEKNLSTTTTTAKKIQSFSTMCERPDKGIF